MYKYLLVNFLIILHFSVEGQKSFTEVSSEAGINHAFVVDQATFGGGAAVIDYDNDGYEDLYITGGVASDVLYRNNGDGTFTNVFENKGFSKVKEVVTQGVTAADVNRDGYKDLFVTTMGYLPPNRAVAPNFIFINQKDGTFKEASETWGISNDKSNSTGATFGDFNLDGFPDLYVANYFAESAIGISIYNEATITNSFVPATDFLYLNTGGGSFIEVSQAYSVDHDGFGFQGLFTDFDNDGDLDLHIANDFGFKRTPNRFYRNDYPKNKFKERSLNLQLNYGMNAMGISGADVNLDGWMDYFVTNLSTSVLVYNRKHGKGFDDKTVAAGVAIQSISDELYSGPPISWGANFFDFDHDMDSDLFVCNGSLNPTIRLNPNLFFRNDNGNFSEVAKELNLFDYRIGRGSVVFDYDNDGDLDLLVVNQAPSTPTNLNGTLLDARCLLYRNDVAEGNWLQVELEGVQSERNGLGSRIEVLVDDLVLIREVEGGASHLSQNTTIAHFGLGDIEEVKSVTVRWLGGQTQTLNNVAANQKIRITEEVDNRDDGKDVKFQVTPYAFLSDVTLEFELPESGSAKIDLFDVQGRLVQGLYRQEKGKVGIINRNIDESLPPGIYFFRLITNDKVYPQKSIKL